MIVSSVRRMALRSKCNLNIIDFYLYNILKHSALSFKNPCLKHNALCFKNPCLKTIPDVRPNFYRYFGTKTNKVDGADSDNENDYPTPVNKKFTKKEIAQRFVTSLGCSEAEALLMLKEYPHLKHLSPMNIKKKIQDFSRIGIEIKDIIQYPWLLLYQKSVIESKVNVMGKLGIKNVSIPMLGVSLKRLKEIKLWAESDVISNEKNRIVYISEKLECDPAEISYAISAHNFIDRIPFERLVTVMEILLKAGVWPDDILRDIWVLRYSKDQVSSRVDRAKEGGIEQFKPWMVRCTEKVFNNTLRRHSEKRVLLGPHKDSAIRYISLRLGVNQAEAKLILTRHPQLRGVGAAKLCNTLDFLLGKEQEYNLDKDDDGAMERSLNEDSQIENAKFDRVQVWTSIRALCHSLETMRVRLSRLRALGYEPYSPSILYKSRKKFEEFVKKLEEKAAQGQSDDLEPNLAKESNTDKSPESRNSATG